MNVKGFNANEYREVMLPAWAQRPDRLEGFKAELKQKPRMNPAQKKALAAYRFAEKQEDRYLGSVFVNSIGQRDHEQRVAAAYQECKRLGMSHEHGL